jgi:hypothetical protein
VEEYFDESCFQLFRSDDEQDLARAIRELRANPARGDRLVQRAITVSESYRWPRQRARYHAIVEQLIASGSRVRPNGRRSERGPHPPPLSQDWERGACRGTHSPSLILGEAPPVLGVGAEGDSIAEIRQVSLTGELALPPAVSARCSPQAQALDSILIPLLGWWNMARGALARRIAGEPRWRYR